MIDISEAHARIRFRFFLGLLFSNLLDFSGCCVDAEPVLHHVHDVDKHHHGNQGNDGHESEGLCHYFENCRRCRRYLTMPTGEAITQTVTRVVSQHRATNSVVLARHIAAQIRSRLTMHTFPSGDTQTLERVDSWNTDT